jgi:vancomycin resistance protein VanW
MTRFYPPILNPKSIPRSFWRRKIGRLVFTTKRYWTWWQHRSEFATDRSPDSLPYSLKKHQSILLRQLKDVEMWLQYNKITNLKLAISKIDGLLIRPHEVFSLWYLVGNPTKNRGFKLGMTLEDGQIGTGYGGGLCQLANLIYWMALHTPLTIKERWHHSYDVFPDVNRTLPFGSGATIAYNYIDLQLLNPTHSTFQIKLWLTDTELCGEVRSNLPSPYHYKIVERNHQMVGPIYGRYIRHNELYRICEDQETQKTIGEELVTVNDALMMYAPLLPESVEFSRDQKEYF